ncbi:sensor domain-containing protein [Plantactinospora sp. GCM10030261]|uniref:sensor domain-containing protein n=1 Tax=Plantactinospora sp. GCM10030261 TaxID=3273420 RepID=UPI00360AF122
MAARGLLRAILAVANPILFALTILSLILIPVFGLGLVLFPLTTKLVRQRAGLARRMADRDDVLIEEPYPPVPAGARIGSWRLCKHLMTDAATWRDFTWLIPGTVVNVVLGGLAFLLPAYGLAGVLLLPGLLRLVGDETSHGITGQYGYGATWPVGDGAAVLLIVPQGLIILAAGLAAAPKLIELTARFDRALLSPTRVALPSGRVEWLAASRADTVDAQAAELRRVERDLHDGAQARLAALGMSIGLAEELVVTDPANPPSTSSTRNPLTPSPPA